MTDASKASHCQAFTNVQMATLSTNHVLEEISPVKSSQLDGNALAVEVLPLSRARVVPL